MPWWQITVVFVYALRRMYGAACDVTVEQVPWSMGKGRLTTAYQLLLAGWAGGSPGKQWTASRFHRVHAAFD